MAFSNTGQIKLPKLNRRYKEQFREKPSTCPASSPDV